jgi:glycerate kinase
MLSALGFRFYNDGSYQGGRMPNACYGAELELLVDYDDSQVPQDVRDTEFVSVCDVVAPLCGPDGAALRYGPQKGMDRYMAEAIESGMRNFADIVKDKSGISLHEMPAAGAAGGVAGAMHAFLGAKMVSGSDVILDAVGFENVIQDADLVITGEGKVDHQTLTGKLPYKVARRAADMGVPVIAICGATEISHLPDAKAIIPITPNGMPLSEAKKPAVAKKNIRTAVSLVLKGQPLP